MLLIAVSSNVFKAMDAERMVHTKAIAKPPEL